MCPDTSLQCERWELPLWVRPLAHLCNWLPHTVTLIRAKFRYLSLESLRQIAANGAWYLSRLSKGVEVYLESHAQAGALVLVDYLQQHYPDDPVIDLPVYIGQERLPCRLLAYRLPADVVKQRQRKASEEARKKGRILTQEYLNWLACGF